MPAKSYCRIEVPNVYIPGTSVLTTSNLLNKAERKSKAAKLGFPLSHCRAYVRVLAFYC